MDTEHEIQQERVARRSGQSLAPAVIAFVKDALADGRVAVDALELKARAAGLLSECQRISNAKLFRAAKRQLRICSAREGFGPQGQWFWSLPCPSPPRTGSGDLSTTRQPKQDTHGASSEGKETPITAEAAAAVPQRAAVLSAWQRLIDQLPLGCPPAGIQRHRWSAFLSDCEIFLKGPNGCADKAADLGWSTEDLFAFPGQWHDSVGLLWEMNSGTLIQIHRDWAEIEAAGRRRRRVFGRPSAIQGRALLQHDGNGDQDPDDEW